jgi:hypothetical protein
MGSRSASELLQLPVQLHGIRLGRAVDVLVDEEGTRVLGIVVLCEDETERFLALAAAEVREDEIAVGSAFLLLEDIGFYRERARSLREIVGDVLISSNGTVGYPRGGVTD